MLREVASLFDTPHVLTLLRQLGEGLEALLNQALPASSPLRACLEEQLFLLEGEPSRWRAACESYLPASVYKELDLLDKHLQQTKDSQSNSMKKHRNTRP